jgi:hypothetical protein
VYLLFVLAGTLIKLIGGRKKSKLLFRSTKIQVFKDINLIRLRDGCSGISMDLVSLGAIGGDAQRPCNCWCTDRTQSIIYMCVRDSQWFPVDPHMLTRSQQHTLLIHQMLSDFPQSFYALAIVLKSFMSQNLLNSGYSGLGSYGVLLMLIRFLQYERFNAQRDHRPEETNLGKLLVGFFRLYATFDYLHKAIDVVHISPDGDFIPKPEVLIVAPARKPVPSESDRKAGRKKRDGDDSDEEEEQAYRQDGNEESGGEDAGGARESASLKKKRSNATDRFTLLILDPMDSKNQIICQLQLPM